MLEALRDLSARTDALRKSVRLLPTLQVRRQANRDDAKEIVDEYFRSIRERMQIAGIAQEIIGRIDADMQNLLDVSRRHSTKATYEECLKQISASLVAAEKAALLGISSAREGAGPEPTDKRILETLSRILPSAARSYEQALRDLGGPDRLSWRGPASDLRECLRETLDHLTPDADVESQESFELEDNASGPTMRRKVRYILSKRGQSKVKSKPSEAAVESVDELVGTFVRSVYTRSNVSTHTPTRREEVLRVHTYVKACLCELLEIHAGS